MDPDFWQQAWREGRTRFHQDRVSPMLAAHWDTAGAPGGSRVFVPLCGKTLDMPWLVERGHRVLGVELSPIAVEGFFAALGITPDVRESRYGKHHVAGPYELILGDAFALDNTALADCAAVYDRAALIALPRVMRTRYLRELYARLPAGCRGLVVTLEYPPAEKQGPPFSVDETEARRPRTWVARGSARTPRHPRRRTELRRRRPHRIDDRHLHHPPRNHPPVGAHPGATAS